MAKKEQKETSWQEDFSSKFRKIKNDFDKKRNREIKAEVEAANKESKDIERRYALLIPLLKRMNANIRRMVNQDSTFKRFVREIVLNSEEAERWVDNRPVGYVPIHDFGTEYIELYLSLGEGDLPHFGISYNGYRLRIYEIDGHTDYLTEYRFLFDDNFDEIFDLMKPFCEPKELSKFLMSKFGKLIGRLPIER